MVSCNTFLAILVVAAALSTTGGAELKGVKVVQHHASRHDATAASVSRFFHAVRVGLSFFPSRIGYPITVPGVPRALFAQHAAGDKHSAEKKCFHLSLTPHFPRAAPAFSSRSPLAPPRPLVKRQQRNRR